MADQWVQTTSQFFSYYPKYEYLDNVLSATGRKRMNLYIDVKGCAQALFQQWAVEYILNASKSSRTVDTSLFAAIIEFVSFHKLYAKKRGVELNMYFFMEQGSSSYHKDIFKDYKKNRKLGDFFGLDDATRELFFKILEKNYFVSDRVLNRIPNTTFIRLEYLEADFIPWYLMKRALPKEDVDSAVNIIYSTDKDMLQCVDAPNVFQFYRHYKSVEMITQQGIYKRWIKEDIQTEDPAEWFSLMLAIIGDSGDGIEGVKGIGSKSLMKIFDYIKTICGGSMDLVYQNIKDKKPIFNKSYDVNNNALKKMIADEEKVIRNIKLISYKMLSDWVDGGYPVDSIEKKKLIEEKVNNKDKWIGSGVLHEALNKAGLMGVITDTTLTNLF